MRERDGDKQKNCHLKTNISIAKFRCVSFYFSLQRKKVNTKLEGCVSIHTQVVFPELQRRNLMNTVDVREIWVGHVA
jgi:hypothetical protein